jgi:hypothetical protein
MRKSMLIFFVFFQSNNPPQINWAITLWLHSSDLPQKSKRKEPSGDEAKGLLWLADGFSASLHW